jgi:uncharacterized membrane protein YsdA (DUF1294 family)
MSLLEFALQPTNVVTGLSAMNFFAFAAFGIDKVRAERGAWRTSEATLLQLAFFGGIAGAYAGRSLFRHKMRKQPFSNQLHTIGAIQLCAAIFLIIFLW